MIKIIHYLLLVLAVLLYTRPFFQKGYFLTDDGIWSVVRLAEMKRELKDIQIPPRWADYLNHGFGYPLFHYTYPLPYYLGAVISYMGIGLVNTIKLLFVASVLFSSIFMYKLGSKLINEYGGLIAALFYISSPYRLVNLYIRGSIGESLSLAIIPALFYFSLIFISTPNWINFVINSLLFASLILTHNITAVVVTPFWLLFIFVVTKTSHKKILHFSLWRIAPLVILGLGLSCYFFMPAILERNFIMLSEMRLADIKNNFIEIDAFLTSKWSYEDGPSFKLGNLHLTAIILTICIFSFKGLKTKMRNLSLFVYLLISIILLIFLTNKYSIIFWNLPPLIFLDFPWRLMTPLIFFISFFTLFLGNFRFSKLIGIALAIVSVIVNLKFAQPNKYLFFSDSFYQTNDATTTSKDELMPIWVSDKPTNRYNNKVEVVNGKAVVSNIEFNSNKINFQINSQSPSTIKINTIYFPGWTVYADNSILDVNFQNPQGVIIFNSAKGNFNIRGEFQNTPIRTTANGISLLSLIIITIYSTTNILTSMKRSIK